MFFLRINYSQNWNKRKFDEIFLLLNDWVNKKLTRMKSDNCSDFKLRFHNIFCEFPFFDVIKKDVDLIILGLLKSRKKSKFFFFVQMCTLCIGIYTWMSPLWHKTTFTLPNAHVLVTRSYDFYFVKLINFQL